MQQCVEDPSAVKCVWCAETVLSGAREPVSLLPQSEAEWLEQAPRCEKCNRAALLMFGERERRLRWQREHPAVNKNNA